MLENNNDLPAYYNGKYMSLSQVSISPLDRGFLFGDSVYEVIPVYQGKPLGGAEHWQRLMMSLEDIGMTSPYSIADLEEIVNPLLDQAQAAQFLYVQITRGVESSRKHRFPVKAQPTILIYSQAFEPPINLDYAGCDGHFQKDLRWQKCQVKSTSLMGNVLAYQTLYHSGYENDEALLVRDGLIVEAPSSNVFMVKNGQILTPPLDNILAGVTRNKVIQLIQSLGLPFCERAPSMKEAQEADEIFVTNSYEELKPLVNLAGSAVGNGKPGPIWQQLFSAYQALKA